MTNGNFIGLATRASQNYAQAQEYESKVMEDYLKRLEGVRRNIQTGGYFEEEGTIDGKAKGSYNPTIPAGFRPVDTDDSQWGDGTKAPDKDDVNNGLVIEDKDGNQFVWVPCYVKGGVSDGTDGLTKYAKHEYTGTDTNDVGVNTPGEDGWLTWSYRKYNDWKDPAVDTDIPENYNYTGKAGYGTESVNKYGGFYVARYEAGIPENANFYPNAENGFEYKPQLIDGVCTPKSDEGIRNVGNIAPVSKKNTASWSWISQENADKASKLMVTGKSYLIDGTAWDTIVNWINQPEVTVNDSSSVGNYYSSTGEIPTGTMYIKHTNNGKWTTGAKYEQATEKITQPSGAGNYRYEVYTGSLDNTKLKNIYDMAGNMWEWTTETGKHGEESDSFSAVIRGGSYYNDAITRPLCHRSGDNAVTKTDFNFGFRVVLYL